MQKRLVIVGAHAIAEVAFEYFTHDSPYEVVAFTLERDFLERDALFGRPVVAFEELEERYPAATHDHAAHGRVGRVFGTSTRARSAYDSLCSMT